MDTQSAPNGGASIVRHEFGATSTQLVRETSQAAMIAQARAQVEAMFIVARANPRSWTDIRVKILQECQRPAFAKAAWFRKPQGGGYVEGLSVRYAEAAMRIAGNFRRGTRTTYEDDAKRQLNIFVIDCETNAETSRDITLDKTVERKNPAGRRVLGQRTNSAGDAVYIVAATEDEMMAKEGSIVSKVGRVLILQMIPGDIRDESEEQILATRANEDAKDPNAARKQLADAFATLAVMPDDLAKFLGHDVYQCTPNEVEDLRGVYATIRDGDATWAELLAEKISSPPAAFGAPTDAFTGSDVAPGVVAQPAPKRSRGSRVASQVRGAETATAPTPTPVVAQVQVATPQTVASVQAPTQVEVVPQPAHLPRQPELPVQPSSQTSTAVPKPAAVPTQAASLQDERDRQVAEQADLLSSWPTMPGRRVVVKLKDREPFETYTTTAPRMYGDFAVVNVDGVDGPVPLSRIVLKDES